MKKIITILTFTLMTFLGFSQKENDSIQLSNVQEYTPSKLLKKGQWDIKFFNSIYTQTKSTDAGSNVIDIPRQSFYTNTNEIYTGISKNSRINIGLIFQIRSNVFDGADALDVFKFKDNDVDARAGFTTIAPSIRVQPFKKLATFSFTSSVYLPVFEDRANAPYLDKRSVFWETKFFYDNTFGNNKWQIFTEMDLGFNFGEKSQDADPEKVNTTERYANNSLYLPFSAFLSYFPGVKSTVYVNAKQAFLIDLGNQFEQNSTSLGLGAKYQITQVLNLELSFDQFVRGHNYQGLGQTYSIGLRALF